MLSPNQMPSKIEQIRYDSMCPHESLGLLH